jgi:hypothetical protein
MIGLEPIEGIPTKLAPLVDLTQIKRKKKAETETNKIITKTQRNLRETIVRKAKSIP